MTTQPKAKSTDNNPEELIQGQQSPGCGSMNTTDPNGGLLLQAVTFRHSDCRKRDDEKRHQPIISEAFAEHVDDASLPWLTEEWQSRRHTRNQSRRNNNESRTETEGESNQNNRNPTQL
jgi:hypothetical protein